MQCNIPERLGLIQAIKWQSSIHDMLSHIPSISSEDLISYFESIDSKLFLYENLRDAPTLLELAIHRNSGIVNTNINAILDRDIVPRVLSYLLTEGDWEEFLDLPNSILGRIYSGKRRFDSARSFPCGLLELRDIA